MFSKLTTLLDEKDDFQVSAYKELRKCYSIMSSNSFLLYDNGLPLSQWDLLGSSIDCPFLMDLSELGDKSNRE